MKRSRPFGLGFVLASSALGLLVAACANTNSGALILAIGTDLAVPDDLDTISVTVFQSGAMRYAQQFPVGAKPNQPLPATLTILPSTHDSNPADIRVVGLHNGTARILRELIVTIPTTSVVLARADLEFLCDGSVMGNGPNDWQSTCMSGQTCTLGACQSASVDASSLPAYQDGQVFGGGDANGGGSCFDTQGCFANSSPGFLGPTFPDGTCQLVAASATGVDPSNPSMGALSPSPVLNVALLLPPNGDGICIGQSGCLVPIDQDTTGWTTANGNIVLPRGVCQRLQQANAPKIVFSTTCPTKIPSTPTCGPWSSVSGMGMGGMVDDGGVPMADGGETRPTPIDSGPADQCNAAQLQPMCPNLHSYVGPMITPAGCESTFGMILGEMCAGLMMSETCACAAQSFFDCALQDRWQCESINGVTLPVPSSPACLTNYQNAANACGVTIMAPDDAGSPTPTCAPLPAGLVSWWRGEGNALDNQQRNPGTLQGVTFGTGLVGQTFVFNGHDQMLAGTAGFPVGGSDRTVEMWVNLNQYGIKKVGGASDLQELFFLYGSQAFGDEFALMTYGNPALVATQWGAALSGGSIPLNQWTHVAVTTQSGNFTLYVNGNVVTNGAMPFATTAGTTFYLGGYGRPGADQTTEQLTGMLDEVSVYSRALSPAEIKSIVAAGASGKCVP
jgi:hypothetical protein